MTTFPSTDTFPSLDTFASEVETARVLSEVAPDTAALYTTNRDGSLARAGGDEAMLTLADYTFTSHRYGGFATADASIVAPARGRHSFAPFQNAVLKLDAGDTLWEGRTDIVGETSGSEIELALIGHSVLLAEAECVFLGVSNDLGLWGDPPVGRIEARGADGISINQQFAIAAGEEGVQITMDSSTSGRGVPASATGEAWWGKYADISPASVQYIASEFSTNNMDSEIRAFPNSTSSASATANLTFGEVLTTFTPSTSQPYLCIFDSPNATVNKAARALTMHKISVFGDHELATYDIDTLPDGLLFSDVLAHLIQTRTTIATSRHGIVTIERSSQPSPNLAWLESATLRDVLEEGLSFEPTFTWGIWEGPTLHYGSQKGARWVVRRADGAEFSDEGDTAEFDFNLVVVNYTDRDGTARRAGPVGWGVDTEDDSLRDPDPYNPATEAGLDKPLVIDIGTASPDKAIELGQIALEEALRPRFAGRVALPRYAERDGVWSPTSLLRGNDVIFDAEHGEELPVFEASYRRSDVLPCEATIDTPANRLDAEISGLEVRPRKFQRRKVRRRLHRQERRLRRRRR